MKRSQIELRRKVLLLHINNYLSKGKIQMKGLLGNLKFSLEGNGKITVRQLESIIPFLNKEKQFKGWNNDQIIHYFHPLLRNRKKETVNGYSNEIEFERLQIN